MNLQVTPAIGTHGGLSKGEGHLEQRTRSGQFEVFMWSKGGGGGVTHEMLSKGSMRDIYGSKVPSCRVRTSSLCSLLGVLGG